MTRSAAFGLARLAVSVLLLAFLFSKVSFRESLEPLSRLAAPPLALAAALVAVDRAISVLKWFVLVRPVLPDYPLGAATRVFFVGNFLGLLLPPGLGNDVLRAVGAWRDTGRGAISVSSVAMDRVLGVVSLVLFAMAMLVVSPVGPAGPELLLPAAVVAAVVTLATAVILDRRLPDKAVALLGKWRRLSPLASVLSRLAAALALYRSHPRALAASFALGLAVQWLRVLIAMSLGAALGLDVSAAAYHAFVPLVMALSLVPITAGGFGLREWGFVGLLSSVGVPEGEAVALSLLTFCASIFGTLPGAWLFLRSGLLRAGSRPPTEVPR
jgi:uncharacterized protein (TIRG00374 family)